MRYTDKEIKNAIARCALSGVSTSFSKALQGSKIVECDLCFDSDRTVQIIATIDGMTRQYEFTVREIYG